MHVVRSRGSALGGVVLGASVNVVERSVVVQGDLVELRDRQVLGEAVVHSAVPRLVEPAVAADDQMVGILRVDPERVVIDVLPALAQGVKGLAAIFGDVQQGVHGINAIKHMGIGIDPLVVLRAAGDVARTLGPAFSTVVRAEKAALAPGGLDRGVENIGIDRRDRQADAPLVAVGKPLVDLPPRLAGVGRSVEARLGPAVDQRPDVSPALVGGGIEDVGIPRIEQDVGHARVLADREHGLPGLAAVGGLVQPPVAARFPERSLSGHVNHIRVPRVDEDLGDVLRAFQPHLGEAGAAVDGFVKSIAIAHAALAVVLAGAHPHDQVVVGINA